MPTNTSRFVRELHPTSDERESVPTCIECGAELASNEQRPPFVCFECATVPCPCGCRHGRGYVCPDRMARLGLGTVEMPETD